MSSAGKVFTLALSVGILAAHPCGAELVRADRVELQLPDGGMTLLWPTRIEVQIQAPIVRRHDRGSGGGQTLLRLLETSLHISRTSGSNCRNLPSGYASAGG